VEQAPQLTARQADRVTLSCAVLAGTPEPRLLWRHSSQNKVVSEGRSDFNDEVFDDLVGEGRRLVFEAVKRSDEGIYTCQADNGYGVASYSSVALTVLCKF